MKSEEQEYWVKHYPHEAETIMTLSDLLDETQDVAAKAQIDYTIGVLRKKEKYRWHDLRKTPEDLPAVEERVVLTVDLVHEHRNVYGHRTKYGAWVVNGFEIRFDVIAWRTDEPFEEDKE